MRRFQRDASCVPSLDCELIEQALVMLVDEWLDNGDAVSHNGQSFA